MYLSIVILNYLSSDKVKNLLNSISTQQFNGEIIVVDNSEEQSEFEVLKGFSSITKNEFRVLRSDNNLGFSNGTNIGIKNVNNSCTHVYILNPDTVLMEDALSYLQSVCSSIDDVMISPRGIKMDSGKDWSFGGKLHFLRGRCDVDNSLKEYSITSDFGTCASLIVPKHLLDRYGLLDEDFFLGGEEWELSLRMRRNGVSIITPTKILYEHEVSGTHKKYGLPFHYMGQRTKVLFMRKCFPLLSYLWLFIYIPSLPLISFRYAKINDVKLSKCLILSFSALYHSFFKNKITKEEFFQIGQIK